MKIPRHFFEKPHWENSYLEGMKRKKLDKKFNLRAKVMFIHIWISVSVFCVIIFPIPDTKKDSIVQCWGGYPLGAWLETSCMNHVVAGDGLMLHAEQFRLRTNSDAEGDCHDYIGFLSQYSSLYSHKGTPPQKKCFLSALPEWGGGEGPARIFLTLFLPCISP